MATMRFAFVLLCLACFAAAAQTSVTCSASGVPVQVRAEGLTERLGDIQMNCTGQPGTIVTASLGVFLNVNVTNRVTDGIGDIAFSIDAGSGPVPAGGPAHVHGNGVQFGPVQFSLSEAGTATLRISNLRGAVSQLNVAPGKPEVIQAFISATNLALYSSTLTIGSALPGLAAEPVADQLTGLCSPLPESPTFTSLTGTFHTGTKVSEAIINAFQPRAEGEDNGTRIAVRYTLFPPEGARLFVPDAIAGTGSVNPTSTGDSETGPSAGSYTPGEIALLLVRVLSPNEDGSGGELAFIPGPPGSGTFNFNSVSEVPVVDGAAVAYFEVVDANPALFEKAEIPVFVGLERSPIGLQSAISSAISFAPISTVEEADPFAPVVRFVETAPVRPEEPNPPKLALNRQEVNFSGLAGTRIPPAYVRADNTGGGLLKWIVHVVYETGSNWLSTDIDMGINTAVVKIQATPGNLAPGTYRGNVVFTPLTGDSATILPVTLQVLPAGPVIGSITNAATWKSGPMAPGSIAAILGLSLGGESASVTFDGVPARLLYADDQQINLRIPTELGTRPSAQMVVSAGGISSEAVVVALTPVAPGIFGILNQDNTANSTENPAPAGSIIQIFATGLPDTGAILTARIHDWTITASLYAGPAPGAEGVHQLNVVIPSDLPAMTAEVVVCAAAAADVSPICSPAISLTVNR